MKTILLGESEYSGRAIGKIILMGEHAVVYGQPALAIPFPLASINVSIREKRGPSSIDSYYYRGPLANAANELLGLIRIIEGIVASFDKKSENFHIKIQSSIPPERGMGSSAAVAVASVRALYGFFKQKLREEDLYKWADMLERLVHGNPSGIDTATIIGERPLYYIKGSPFLPISLRLDAYLIVADTGELGQTSEAVSRVKSLIESNPKEGESMILELGKLTKMGKSAIEKGDRKGLGLAMSQGHRLLDKLGVSCNKLNRLVDLASRYGALGAKLTGGGRGGLMISLAESKERAKTIEKALLNNGATKTWIYYMGAGYNGT